MDFGCCKLPTRLRPNSGLKVETQAKTGNDKWSKLLLVQIKIRYSTSSN